MILTTMKVQGDPDELLRDKQQHLDPIAKELAPANGGLEHIVVRTDEGLMIFNLWESEGGMEKVFEEVRPRAEAAGMAAPTDWRKYEVVQREVPS